MTWCSGVAAIAAGRRWSVIGDAGGRIEVDSVWIHLDPASARRGSATSARTRSLRRADGLDEARAPRIRPARRRGRPWPLRSTDLDAHGHVNNAVYWQAVEDRLLARRRRSAPCRARLDYRDPIDLGDAVELAAWEADGRSLLAFEAGGKVRAVAALEPLASA